VCPLLRLNAKNVNGRPEERIKNAISRKREDERNNKP
jgi:hypothetical protein